MNSLIQVLEFESAKKADKTFSKNTSIKKLFFILFTSFYLLILTIFITGIVLLRFFFERKTIPKYFVHSLSFDQIYSLDRSDQELFDFLCENRFKFSKNVDDYLVEIPHRKSFCKDKMKKTRSISFYLLIHCLATKQLIELISLNWANAAILFDDGLFTRIRPKRFFRIFFDYFVWRIVELPIESTFITTQSSVLNLPAVFYINRKDLNRIMIWYSTNSKPIMRKNVLVKDFLDLKDLSMFVDMNFVWEETDNQYLSRFGVTKTKVVGSILFYPKNLKKQNEEKTVVTYFDITPFENFEGFLSESMLSKNILGIFQTIETIQSEFELKLKPKRLYSRVHSKSYIRLIEKLSTHRNVKLLPPRTNLYELISQSDFVLAVPFSSTALIAKELGIPTAYVCLLPRDYILQDVNSIPVLTSKMEILNFITRGK